jgi:hypothetical protein
MKYMGEIGIIDFVNYSYREIIMLKSNFCGGFVRLIGNYGVSGENI